MECDSSSKSGSGKVEDSDFTYFAIDITFAVDLLFGSVDDFMKKLQESVSDGNYNLFL